MEHVVGKCRGALGKYMQPRNPSSPKVSYLFWLVYSQRHPIEIIVWNHNVKCYYTVLQLLKANNYWTYLSKAGLFLPVKMLNWLVFILFLSTAHFQIKSEESQSMPVTVSGSHSLMSTSADHSSLQPHSPVQSQADDHTDSNTKTDVQHDDDPNTMDEIKVRQFRNNTYHCIHLYIFCWVFECFFCCKNIVYQVIWE